MSSDSPCDTGTDPVPGLLDRWRHGEQESLGLLVTAVLPWLQKEVDRVLGERCQKAVQDIPDVVQTSVLSFLTWGPRFVPRSGGELRALLRRIVINEVIDQQRRRARSERVRRIDSVLDSAGPVSAFAAPSRGVGHASHAAERSEDSCWVHLALQFLSEEERYLLLASQVEGLDWSTIATELGLSSASVARMRCNRLKPRVANILRRLRSGSAPTGA